MAARKPRQDAAATRRQMVDAALATLKEEGFARTTARAVARRGGFNQALVYYHFGGLDELLLAALDASSGARLERYRAAIDSAGSTPELLARARELFHGGGGGGRGAGGGEPRAAGARGREGRADAAVGRARADDAGARARRVAAARARPGGRG